MKNIDPKKFPFLPRRWFSSQQYKTFKSSPNHLAGPITPSPLPFSPNMELLKKVLQKHLGNGWIPPTPFFKMASLSYFPIRCSWGCSINTFVINAFINSLSCPFVHTFKTLSIPNCKNCGADILRECSSLTMCHMSHAMFQVSHVRCHMSFFCFLLLFYFGHSGGASPWRVCYQWGLPRLV